MDALTRYREKKAKLNAEGRFKELNALVSEFNGALAAGLDEEEAAQYALDMTA